MEAKITSVIYMGLISGPNKADDTCGKTTGTMERGFTVYIAVFNISAILAKSFLHTLFILTNMLLTLVQL
jgi:hypothetical protein